MLELYRRIKSRREELGMTQDDLARRLGYKSRSSIQKIEKGENDIPQSKVKAFAEALDTTPEYLMGWTPLSDKEESKLLKGFRELNEENKNFVMELITKLIMVSQKAAAL